MKNKLKKISKFIIHNTFGFLIGILIAGTTVYAATVISGSSISYDNSNSTLEATNVQDALDELTSKTFQCPNNYDLCAYDVKLGDYVISYSPTLTTFTIPASMTGYDTDQTINPQELTRWRIINIGNDGTIDMISEYTSSTPVYFKGKVGAQNYVATLTYIAGAYMSTESNNAIGSRCIGYSGQLPTLPESYFNTLASTTMGNDTYYTKDINLVQSALGTLKAYKYGTTEYAHYWLASRYCRKFDSLYGCDGRIVDPGGVVTHYGYQGYGASSVMYGGAATNPSGFASYIRPIITIRADSTIMGASAGYNGTSDKPWQLD